MTASDAEYSTLVRDDGSTELGDAERVIEGDLVRHVLLHIKEVDGLAAPLEIMDKLVGRVALFENKCVVQKLAKLVYHVDVVVLGDPATEFAQLTHFKDEVLLDLIELAADELKGIEVPFLAVGLEIDNFFFELFQLSENRRDFKKD